MANAFALFHIDGGGHETFGPVLTMPVKESADASRAVGASALEAEFDVVAGWTLDAIRQLGADHALPASCRGTSNPAMLDWLSQACGLSPGEVLLDVGGGMGGPAAYAAQRFGIRPIIAEPMPKACHAASELFGLEALVAEAGCLPIEAVSVDAAWCLGVLCTTTEKAETLAELHRVLRPAGSLGLMVLTADDPHPERSPEGNVFPSHSELKQLLTDAGFDLVQELDCDTLDGPPCEWTERLVRVQDRVRSVHADDPLMAVANDQASRLSCLRDNGRVRTWLLHATAR